MRVRRCADCHKRADSLEEYSDARRLRRILCLGRLAGRRSRGEQWWVVR